jgi:hypothetical protein
MFGRVLDGIPRTEDMTVRQGFDSGRLAWRTRSTRRGGSRIGFLLLILLVSRRGRALGGWGGGRCYYGNGIAGLPVAVVAGVEDPNSRFEIQQMPRSANRVEPKDFGLGVTC